MMIKYENVNQYLRRVTFLVAIGALTACGIANAFPIEPLDMDFVGPAERDEMHEKDLENKYEKVKDRIDNGTATEKDYDFHQEYLNDHFSTENDRSASDNDGGGTYSNGSYS